MGLLDGMVILFLVFWEPLYGFPKWPHQFTFPLTVYKGFLLSTSSPTLATSYFDNSHSNYGFDLHFPDYWCWISMCLLAVLMSSLEEKEVFLSFVHILSKLWLLLLLLLSCMSSSYIYNNWYDIWLAKISCSVDCLFSLLIISFVMQKSFI